MSCENTTGCRMYLWLAWLLPLLWVVFEAPAQARLSESDLAQDATILETDTPVITTAEISEEGTSDRSGEPSPDQPTAIPAILAVDLSQKLPQKPIADPLITPTSVDQDSPVADLEISTTAEVATTLPESHSAELATEPTADAGNLEQAPTPQTSVPQPEPIAVLAAAPCESDCPPPYAFATPLDAEVAMGFEGDAGLISERFNASQSAADFPTVARPNRMAQTPGEAAPSESETADSQPIREPADRSEVFTQAAILQQGNEFSARLRGGGIYVLSPSVFVGAVVDLTTGSGFSNGAGAGLDINELYITASPANMPELRFTAGLMDLTSYFDRNSFAKDSLTHFFNPVFQTNPALSTVNISSRPGFLVNWTPIDNISLTASTFSSSRSLGKLSLDSYAGEIGVRFGNAIVRGTYVSSRDAGNFDGFQESYLISRSNGGLGVQEGDSESGFGINAEYFIPQINLGLFGRYGSYTNHTLGESGTTYSFGVNALDVFMPDDRLGLGYGRQLSNSARRQEFGTKVPDVWELFYDARLSPHLRAGVTLQERNGFSETWIGFRVRYDMVWPIGRIFQ